MKTTFCRVNLCCGPAVLADWINVDCYPGAQVVLDLEKDLLPFSDDSVAQLVCISAINYFTLQRGREIIQDVHRVLRPGGVARFGVQDLRILTSHYLNRNADFYYERLPDGRDRYPGRTFAEKFNAFCNGFPVAGHPCKFIYDYETLSLLFTEAGFDLVEEKNFGQSRIDDVLLLDNRKEQMFFLEAVKESLSVTSQIKYLLAEAQSLDTRGQHEAAWQRLLRVSDLAAGDKECLDLLVNGSLNAKLPDQALRALHHHAQFLSEDVEVQAAIQRIESSMQSTVFGRCKEKLVKSFYLRKASVLATRRNDISDDLTHLTACLDWIVHAHEISSDRGIPAMYYLLENRWDVSYPETTGYCIPTLLAGCHVTRNEKYRDIASVLGAWEIDIQLDTGGAGEPLGVFAAHPRVFNTAQVVLGWLALYRESNDARWLEPALKAALWIVSLLDEKGRWTQYVYQGMRAYKSRVVWALLELYSVTGEQKLLDGANRALQWILLQAQPNGWFSENSLSDPDHPWTHLTAYTQVGLCEIVRMGIADCDSGNVMLLLEQAATHLCKAQEEVVEVRESGGRPFSLLPGTFDSQWRGSDQWSCLTGNAQTAFFLLRLAQLTGKSAYAFCADSLLDDLKRVHLLDGIDDPNLYGGLPGSYPIGIGYCPWSLPNWAPKFFADALLARIVPNNLYCLS